IAAMHGMTQRRALGQEHLAEARGIHLAALEAGPGIAVRIGGIDPAQEILRQAAFLLELAEGIERRGEDHPAEIPQDGPDTHAFMQRFPFSCTYYSRRRCRYRNPPA